MLLRYCDGVPVHVAGGQELNVFDTLGIGKGTSSIFVHDRPDDHRDAVTARDEACRPSVD